jgi:hypothetical protein
MFVLRAKVFVSLAALILSAFLLGPATRVLSQTGNKGGADDQASKDITITGCLQKGGADGEFNISGPDGTSYQLVGTKVALKDHVGHKVTITGRAAKPEDGAAAGGRLEVTNLRVVSTNCS